MERKAETVRVGTWLYDGAIETAVRIVRQNWDAYHEEGYSDGPPELNAEGDAYYVVYGAASPTEDGRGSARAGPFPRSRTCLSLEEALALAEATVTGPIDWGRLPAGGK